MRKAVSRSVTSSLDAVTRAGPGLAKSSVDLDVIFSTQPQRLEESKLQIFFIFVLLVVKQTIHPNGFHVHDSEIIHT